MPADWSAVVNFGRRFKIGSRTVIALAVALGLVLGVAAGSASATTTASSRTRSHHVVKHHKKKHHKKKLGRAAKRAAARKAAARRAAAARAAAARATAARAAARAAVSARAVAVKTPPAGPAAPFDGRPLYVSPTPTSQALATGAVLAGSGDAALLAKIAAQPQALWLGSWVSTAKATGYVAGLGAGARAQDAVLPLVVYDIPARDCGSYSAGGAADAAAYRAWIDAVAAGIGSTRTAVVLEPDALAGMDCLPAAGQTERLALLRYATHALAGMPHTAVYLDAGNSRWKAPEAIAARLAVAGVAEARGFALNVSNFGATAGEVAYGRAVSALVGGKPFVVDTSRNGNGAPDAKGVDGWCNPAGRALGARPTATTGIAGVDAFLWVKTVGTSDGACHPGEPAAGTWSRGIALGLAARAAW